MKALACLLMMTLSNPILARAAESPQPEAKFPPLTSTNLEKQTFHLPQDFAGERNLLFVAFERKQQDDVDTWLAKVKQFQAADPALAYYEIPTIDRLNPLARWFINNGMRGGIPDLGARQRTITLYLDKQPFKDSLRIPSEATISIFVVNKAGDVLWRAEGDFDAAKGESLPDYLRRSK
jgi:hypothetical protein